jgi:hypothetical protein
MKSRATTPVTENTPKNGSRGITSRNETGLNFGGFDRWLGHRWIKGCRPRRSTSCCGEGTTFTPPVNPLSKRPASFSPSPHSSPSDIPRDINVDSSNPLVDLAQRSLIHKRRCWDPR